MPREGRAPEREQRAPLEVSIEALAAGGDGIGHAPDGRVVFVPFTAPGDRVRVRIDQERRRYLRGRVVELLDSGPDRTDPLCAVFGVCGGCAWQHVAYPAQLEAKRAILHDAIERIARLPVPEALTVHGSPSPYGYRGRARVLVQGGRAGFRKRHSHAVVAADRCPVLVAALDAPLRELGARGRAQGEWELLAGRDGTACVVRLPVRDSAEGVELEVSGERLRVSAGSFVQANALLLDALADALWSAAGSGLRGLELFAGSGFFTLGLARRFERLVAVEASPHAVADLEENLHASGLSNVEIAAGRVEDQIGASPIVGFEPEVVVLDPPRTGLDSDALRALIELAPARIVYLSCDPATLARDLGVLGDRGYALVSLAGFDLMPQTAHVEALAVLERS